VSLPKLILKPRKARPLFSRHPWLFEKAIARIEGSPTAGDIVEVLTDKEEFVAYGLFNPASLIRARLYSWNPSELIDDALIAHRVNEAILYRKDVLHLDDPQGACRLVYSESDGLSGIIIDRFADVVSIQVNSRAMEQFIPTITEAIKHVLSPRAIVQRIDQTAAQWEQLTLTDGVIAGVDPGEPIEFEESGVRLLVDPVRGQKTGGYLDQRENRKAAAFYAEGRDVLDLFCYAGGFGLVAAKAGSAKSVTFVDSSADALALAEKNAQRNEVQATFMLGDVGRVTGELARAGRRFGMVVCDPPKFASKAADIEGALRGYDFINRSAISLVEPGGILVTCSCSGLISPELFLEMLAEASFRSAREIRLIEVRGQAPDHPVSLACPETAYLKCVIARVM
jgi:23S rRNA (cytosine1962-C5)-methyltransferase